MSGKIIGGGGGGGGEESGGGVIMIGLELYFKLWNTDPQFNETPTSRVRMAQGNVTVQFISKVRRLHRFIIYTSLGA